MPYKDPTRNKAYQRDYYAKTRGSRVKRKNKTRRGLPPISSPEYRSAYYAANSERIKSRVKAIRPAATFLYLRCRRRRISITKYLATWQHQGGRCAICRREFQSHPEGFLDHDHSTNLFRSILCTNCNALIGQAHENVVTLDRAIVYLNQQRS